MNDTITFKQVLKSKVTWTGFFMFLLGETLSRVLLAEDKLNRVILQVLNYKINLGVILK